VNPQMMVARIATANALDSNGVIWPGVVLREKARLFNGKPVFPAHPEKRVGRDPLGHLREVQWVGSDDKGYLCGLIRPEHGRLELLLREAAVAGQPLGLSMHVDARMATQKSQPDVGVVTDVLRVHSVDLVSSPAIAGARILTEASGAPILMNDSRVVTLLEGRPTGHAPGDLAALERRLERIVENLNRKPVAESAVSSALAGWGTQVASDFVAKFQERYGPGPWRIRAAS